MHTKFSPGAKFHIPRVHDFDFVMMNRFENL